MNAHTSSTNCTTTSTSTAATTAATDTTAAATGSIKENGELDTVMTSATETAPTSSPSLSYVHIQCLHFSPLTLLSDPIPPSHTQLTCDLCTTKRGLCIQCCSPTCRLSYHIPCAQKQTFYFELRKTSSGSSGGEGGEGVEEEEVRALSYCREHGSEAESESSGKKAMREEIIVPKCENKNEMEIEQKVKQEDGATETGAEKEKSADEISSTASLTSRSVTDPSNTSSAETNTTTAVATAPTEPASAMSDSTSTSPSTTTPVPAEENEFVSPEPKSAAPETRRRSSRVPKPTQFYAYAGYYYNPALFGDDVSTKKTSTTNTRAIATSTTATTSATTNVTNFSSSQPRSSALSIHTSSSTESDSDSDEFSAMIHNFRKNKTYTTSTE